MSRKGGLGKGLDALIPSGSLQPESSGVFQIQVSKIISNPYQPRLIVNQDELKGLCESIKEHGILQPLLLSQSQNTDEFILIAGERRLRAAQMAGLEFVPALIRQVSDQQRLEMALIENIQRTDLTPLETAEAYRQLSEDFNLSHEEIAMRVGKNRSTISNTIRLLKLPEEIRLSLQAGKISEGHARALLPLTSIPAQLAVLSSILKNELSVRQTEELVKKMSGEKISRHLPDIPSLELKEIEDRLRSHLGTRVALKHGRKGGSVVIYYYSDEELDNIISTLLKE
jgi:ParB family chromosome partitioning protein